MAQVGNVSAQFIEDFVQQFALTLIAVTSVRALDSSQFGTLLILWYEFSQGLSVDLAFLAENRHLLGYILQLAHVARPFVVEHKLLGVVGERNFRQPVLFCHLHGEEPEQQYDVVAALTPKGLVAYVEKYAEVTGGADVSGLTPEIAECLVAGYKELASGADVSLLKPDEIVAYVSSYARCIYG